MTAYSSVFIRQLVFSETFLFDKQIKNIWFEIKTIDLCDLFFDDRYYNRFNIYLCVMNSHNIVVDACSKVV